MGDLFDRRRFLETAAAAGAAVLMRPWPHHRTPAWPAAAVGKGAAVPVTVQNTGTFNVPPPAFPDSTTTGFANAPGYPGGPSDIAGTSLTNGSGIAIQSNTTYKYYKNLGQFSTFFYGAIGTTSAPVSNVTFIGCLWENATLNGPAVSLCATGPVTFSYCTFRPAGLTAPPCPTRAQGYQYGITGDGTQAVPGTWNSFCQALTVDHCDMWGFANATKVENGTQAAPHIYQYNYIHDPRVDDSGTDADHTDGIGCPAGGAESYTQITGNTIGGLCHDATGWDTQGLAYQNSPGPSSWDHFTVTGNWFSGCGVTINIIGGTTSSPSAPTNLTFTGNTFSTKWRPLYRPLYDASIVSGTGILWRGNIWRVPAGAEWGNPAHDGLFWMPVASDIAGTDDTPYVSVTDFM